MADKSPSSRLEEIRASLKGDIARYKALPATEKMAADAARMREIGRTAAQFENSRLRREWNDPLVRAQAELEDRNRVADASLEAFHAKRASEKAAAVKREEAMIESLAALATLAQREHDDAVERERVAALRHSEAMDVARSGAFWAKFAGIAGVVAVVATIAVAI